MKKTFLSLLLLCFGLNLSFAQTQTLEDYKKLCAESKLAWEKARDACTNNYTYMMKVAFMPSEYHHELLVEVAGGKVFKTTLKKFKSNKLTETSTDLVKTFADNPVGTIDDIYAEAENRVFKYDPKVYTISFAVDKNKFISYLGWSNPESVVPDRATPSYNIQWWYSLGINATFII